MTSSSNIAPSRQALDGSPWISSLPPELLDPLLALGLDSSASLIDAMAWAVNSDVSPALKYLIAGHRLLSSQLPSKDRELAERYLVDKASSFLASAASFGHGDCMRELLACADATADRSSALRSAAYSGYADGVRMLIPLSHPEALDSAAFCWAIQGACATGSLDCIHLLLPVSNPNALDCAALRSAIEKRASFELVELLVSHFKPTANLPDLFALAKKAKHSNDPFVAEAIYAIAESRDFSLSAPAPAARAPGRRI